MKRRTQLLTTLFLILIVTSCQTDIKKQSNQTKEYVPVDQKLFDEIKMMDKIFFDAYNNCDLEKQASIYANNIEFFHDKGGLMTSKDELIEATKKNICGKVTRELVEGSIEVYPINNYGAIQIGLHKFFNNQEPNAESKPSKFITTWQNDNGNWKMAKVISLH